jgi:hypothetical protein
MPLDLVQERVEEWIKDQKLNGATGMSDIEGKVAREAMSECGQRANFNGATGASDMAGKAVR